MDATINFIIKLAKDIGIPLTCVVILAGILIYLIKYLVTKTIPDFTNALKVRDDNDLERIKQLQDSHKDQILQINTVVNGMIEHTNSTIDRFIEIVKTMQSETTEHLKNLSSDIKDLVVKIDGLMKKSS